MLVTIDVINFRMNTKYPADSSDMPYGQYNNFVQNFITSGSNGQFSHVPIAFPKLREMTVAELQELKNDAEKQDAFLKELPELIHLSKLKDQYIKENKELARENLSHRPELERTKKMLIEKLEHLNQLKRQFDDGNHLYDVLSDSYSLTFLQQRLQVAAVEAEEESDKIAEKFLDGNLTADEFLVKFTEKRVLFHKRQAKKEKLGYQLAIMKRPAY